MTDEPGMQQLEDTEARLRHALANRTGQVHTDEGAGLRTIERRVQAARRGRRLRRGIEGALAVAAAVALTAVAVPALRDDGREQVGATGQAASTTTTAATSPTTVPDAPAPPDTVWPPPGHEQSTDPVGAARSFVEDYVGLPDPPLSDFRPDSGPTGKVDVYQRAEGGAIRRDHVLGTVSLRQTAGGWAVTGATTADIVVDNPAPSVVVGSPVVVDGRGRGYEGTIIVNVRESGMRAGDSLAQAVGIAGCCDELLPFHFELALDRPPSQPTGSVLLQTDSGLDSGASFAVVPVRFGPTPTSGPQVSDETIVKVGWTRASGEVATTSRTVRISGGVLRGALYQLLYGPHSVERDDGLSSGLADEAAAVAVTVVITDGKAVVDFGADLPRVSPGTSSSEASRRFLRQLQATVFQFPTVTSAEYRVGGSCEAFWAWLQRPCTPVDKDNRGA
ncbi:MAG: Gmad2 immunoglobulin-like domain-containing protein [Acidimicrobiales bacterium]